MVRVLVVVGALLAVLVATASAVAAAPPERTGWLATADPYKTNLGQRYEYSCEGQYNTVSVWGTDYYTTDSSVCNAAIHAGLITKSGGTVTIEIAPGRSSYPRTTRNGFTSSTFQEATTSSFFFPAAKTTGTTMSTAPASQAPLGGTGWNATAAAYGNEVGKQYRFACPAGGEDGHIWGSGVYSAESSVCTAAVHTGIITFASGGTVTIKITVHQGAYPATPRFGVTPRPSREDPCPVDGCDHSFQFVNAARSR